LCCEFAFGAVKCRVLFEAQRNFMDDISQRPLLAAALAIFGRPAAIVDLETTGGSFDTDRITEIAFLRFDGGTVTPYHSLVHPERPIPPFIRRLTGIGDETVAGAPPEGGGGGCMTPQSHERESGPGACPQAPDRGCRERTLCTCLFSALERPPVLSQPSVMR